jgi:choline-sulfatase
MRVPLLMAGPGIPGGRKVPGLVRLVDVAPTLLDVLGLPAASARDGRSLAAALRDGAAVPELASYGEDGDRLYIAPKAGRVSLEHKDLSLRTRSTCYVVRPATGAEELYDLAADPAESRSVAADPAHGPLKAKLRAELMAATDFASYLPGGAGVSMGDDEEMRETLRQLGYIGGDAPSGATTPAPATDAPSPLPADPGR